MPPVLTRATVTLSLDFLKTNAGDLSTATDPLRYSKRYSFTSGVDALQAEEFWADRRTLAATTAENIDLAGSLVSSMGYGTTIAFKKVKGLFIIHETDDASASLQVGGHATAALPLFGATPDLATAQPYHIVKPGGWLPLVAPDAAGYTVTATTADLLRIYNSAAAAVTYVIIILGTTT